jgi:hypothetical protein
VARASRVLANRPETGPTELRPGANRHHMEHDLPEDAIGARGELQPLLAALPFFEHLELATVGAIAAECEWLSVPGGTTLFETGDPPDALYIRLSGKS